ncbi:hypothetical protein M5X00_31585 [Paenibacillus alvei]|uniref:hypothetical protein n=1 Tax=Paenibacillus alvei TaxID=44250 RepID=UPI00028A0463|nr:hypothetical protein [Paenibacillus alvei]EJW14774.1 hypothetical protein PAV_11c01150 [Paenibacillus alvei DSM 29]MCY9543811.1 hypothetical protein [Paenibacillus alvei]MCY9708494.1 hypothetical protein [Paenibacillus alvei]MCY9738342.1 hypothetical protein [Paenibacillus alvei]MCY9758765.1 hypothetical protein [Paenibacillus alvei]
MIIKGKSWRSLNKGERESAIDLMVQITADWREKMIGRAIKEYMPVYRMYLDAKNSVEAAQYQAQMKQIERKYGIPAGFTI